jgi:hypothetical protein
MGKCRAALRKSLARARSLRTKVTIVAADANGNKTKQTRTITIR